jgi:hypothetical protein
VGAEEGGAWQLEVLAGERVRVRVLGAAWRVVMEEGQGAACQAHTAHACVNKESACNCGDAKPTGIWH